MMALEVAPWANTASSEKHEPSNNVQPKKGDRLAFLIFADMDNFDPDGQDQEQENLILGSMLNFQRQHVACLNHHSNASFGWELLGHRDVNDGRYVAH
jgi:hypothetical protein